jgi:DNA-binding FrmR family transcriptional regulator
VTDDAGIGVGPHPEPWPDDARLDPQLLAEGDRRNVVDRYRYWRVEAIVADLDERRFPLEVAIENWEHDLNIGTVVRNANAFGVGTVHIVGRRRWNRRGAMVTDRYLHVEHHADVASLVEHAAARDLEVVGIDNLDGSVPLEHVTLPERALLVFGQEGPRPLRVGAGRRHDGLQHHDVRLDQVDQRGCGVRDRPAHLGGDARARPFPPIPWWGMIGGMHGYSPETDAYLKRLRRIEGQVRGLQRMVEEEEYCIDVLTQISAVTRALQGVALGLLEDHVRHCVADALEEGGDAADEKLTEASEAIRRLVRS